MENLNINGYECVKSEFLEEIDSKAYVFKNKKSALKLIYFETDSDESFFSFCFPTIPESDKGTAHIVEHVTLSGSSRYPYKDSFKELDAKSVATFQNAMTFQDITIYPSASLIYKDFEQLFKVYADAVFSPLLSKESFEIEGIKRTEGKDGKISVNGVVLSEMLSDAFDKESIGYYEMKRTLFKGTPYVYNSGGDPKSIVTLTYDEFLNFYKKHYRLSNCTLVFSGRRDSLKVLKALDEYINEGKDGCNNALSDTDANSTSHSSRDRKAEAKATKGVESLLFYKHPEDRVVYYQSESKKSKPSIVLHLLSDVKRSDAKSMWILRILEDTLLSTAMSPLSKALSDSKRGGDISSLSGLSSSDPFALFSLGLDDVDLKSQDVNSSEIKEQKDFLKSTLLNVINNALDEKFIESSFKYYEFKLREKDSSRPLALDWTRKIRHEIVDGDDDIFKNLRSLSYIDEIKKEYSNNKNLFRDFFNEHFTKLDKTSLIVSYPSEDVIKSDEALRIKNAEMTHESESTNESDIRALNSIITKLPIENKVTVDELMKLYKMYNYDEYYIGSSKYVFNRVNTSGITYIDMLFDVSDFTQSELVTLKLLSKHLTHIDVADMTNVEFVRELLRCTGSYAFSLHTYEEDDDDNRIKAGFKIKAKVLDEDIDRFFSLISTMMKGAHYENKEHLDETLVDYKGTVLSLLNQSPIGLFLNSLSRSISKMGSLTSSLSGLEYVKGLYAIKKSDYNSIIDAFSALFNRVFKRERLTLFITSEEAHLNSVKAFINTLESDGNFKNVYLNPSVNKSTTTLYSYPFSTSYNSLVYLYKRKSTPAALYADYIDAEIIFDAVRTNGGAYGASSNYSRNGVFLLSSFQDPNIKKSFDTFDHIFKNLPSPELLESAKIKELGALATIKMPSNLHNLFVDRYITKYTNEDRLSYINSVKNVKLDDILKEVKELSEVPSVKVSLGSLKNLKNAFGKDAEIIEIMD